MTASDFVMLFGALSKLMAGSYRNGNKEFMAFRVHSTRDRTSHRMEEGEGRAKGMRVFPLDQELRRQFWKWGGGSQDLNIFNLNIYSLAWALCNTNGITCHSSLVCRVHLSHTTDMSRKLCAFVQWYFPGHVGIQIWGEPGRERFLKHLVGCRYAAGEFLDPERTHCVEECPLPAFPSVHVFTRRHTGTGRTHHRSQLEQWYWWHRLERLRIITKSVCSENPKRICAAAHKIKLVVPSVIRIHTPIVAMVETSLRFVFGTMHKIGYNKV